MAQATAAKFVELYQRMGSPELSTIEDPLTRSFASTAEFYSRYREPQDTLVVEDCMDKLLAKLDKELPPLEVAAESQDTAAGSSETQDVNQLDVKADLKIFNPLEHEQTK